MTCLEWVLIAQGVLLTLWGCHERGQFRKEQTRSAHWRWMTVKACEILMAERGGGTELAHRVAKDFCRYTPPDVVIESFLGDEAKEP